MYLAHDVRCGISVGVERPRQSWCRGKPTARTLSPCPTVRVKSSPDALLPSRVHENIAIVPPPPPRTSWAAATGRTLVVDRVGVGRGRGTTISMISADEAHLAHAGL